MSDRARADAPTAVILAAGQGSRLRNGDESVPKPLVSLVCLSLAEHCICGLLEAGIRRFVVVLGHEAERIRAHSEQIGRRRACEVTFVVAEDWSEGNGSSTLAARAAVGLTPFLLTMVDHVLPSSMIETVLGSPPSAQEIVLAVDRCKEETVFDPADLTKVSLQGDQVRLIGKELTEWDAGDTGLF